MKIPSAEWSSRVLRLYRQLLKEGKSLQYTDYDFFRRTIRREFDQQRDELEIKVIKKQYEVLLSVCLFFFIVSFTVSYEI